MKLNCEGIEFDCNNAMRTLNKMLEILQNILVIIGMYNLILILDCTKIIGMYKLYGPIKINSILEMYDHQ